MPSQTAHSARSTVVASAWFMAVVGVTLSISCGARATSVEYESDGPHTFTDTERATIERIAETTAREVKVLLPGLPAVIAISVRAGEDVIPETGETASVYPPNRVSWVVDPAREGGIAATATRELRGTLFHELHHLVRGTALAGTSLLDRAVTEGMATAFERDFAGMDPPWGSYEDGIATWATEFLALPADASHEDWMVQHPDGRRWIGFRVGTYLVDRATAASGRRSADLVMAPTSEVLELASKP
ncbi:MAG: DUF2268 domain-containing putative Zn-dependent protease [Vicinamibacterales bacterium]